MTDEGAPSEGEPLQYISCYWLTIRSEEEGWNSVIEWKHWPCMQKVGIRKARGGMLNKGYNNQFLHVCGLV